MKNCDGEASAKWYAKNVNGTPADRGVVKVSKILKDNDIVAAPFDKGMGFSEMKRQSYQTKLAKVLDCSQFQEIYSAGDKLL